MMIQPPPQFDTKDPDEEVVITLDASLMLAPGETLASITSVSIVTTIGGDETPTLVLSGQLITSTPVTLLNGKTLAAGSAFQALATGGNFGSSYWIRAVCPTSTPNKVLTLKAMLPMSAM
jgi:hypothetical protein